MDPVTPSPPPAGGMGEVADRPAGGMGGIAYRRSPAVLWRSVGADVLVAHRAGGDPELLADTAAAIWHCLTEPATVAEVTAALADVYAAPPERLAADVAAFLTELADCGYVQRVGGPR